MRLSPAFTARLGVRLLRALELTLRWDTDDASRARLAWLRAHTGREPFILALWHNRILVVPFLSERYFLPNRGVGYVLTSQSRDGEMLTQFAASFGLGAVRGSARRRAAESVRELVDVLKSGHDICVTPDGSRGPRYELKPGLVKVAQLTGAPIFPFSVEFSRRWRLRTWDGFMIPQPFARVTLRIGEPLRVPAGATSDAAFEEERLRCEAALMALTGER